MTCPSGKLGYDAKADAFDVIRRRRKELCSKGRRAPTLKPTAARCARHGTSRAAGTQQHDPQSTLRCATDGRASTACHRSATSAMSKRPVARSSTTPPAPANEPAAYADTGQDGRRQAPRMERLRGAPLVPRRADLAALATLRLDAPRRREVLELRHPAQLRCRVLDWWRKKLGRGASPGEWGLDSLDALLADSDDAGDTEAGRDEHRHGLGRALGAGLPRRSACSSSRSRGGCRAGGGQGCGDAAGRGEAARLAELRDTINAMRESGNGGGMRKSDWPNGTPIRITPEAAGMEAADGLYFWLKLAAVKRATQ